MALTRGVVSRENLVTSTNLIFCCVSLYVTTKGENTLCECLKKDGMSYTRNNDTLRANFDL